MKEQLRGSLQALGLCAALAVALSYGGYFHPLGDSLAVFRPYFAAALVLGALVLWPLAARWSALACAVVGAVALGPILTLGQGAAAGTGGMVIYQKNLNFRLPDIAPVARDIRASGADFVTLQEVSTKTRPILQGLAAEYPYGNYCDFAGVGGTAVLSRWPAVPGSARCARGMTALQVQTPSGPLWLVSLHLHWPWPHSQAAQVNRLLPILARIGDDGPVMIGGDFNMVPWSNTLRQIGKATGSARPGPVISTRTLFKGAVQLPIDHVMVPAGAGAEVSARPRFGSDHRGILARVALPRG
ncbi:MAG: endonuclease/exonuclease/phosphatase family protein [Rhodobacteraceae bacterium]|nr:endonuclease/exonuclease/phosphatase family protein [Paracoccaceae bacterium]